MALTDKQEAFCREYLIDLNATQAAIRAGYSEKTAKDIACQNLAKLNIQKRIQTLMEERKNRIEVNADYVLKRLVEIDQ
ncbi:MAG TPA: terminase small subunit, partial [Arsenophonus apicola]